MDNKIKQYCEVCDKEFLDTPPVFCCSGRDCGDRGWLYDKKGARTGICPCHY